MALTPERSTNPAQIFVTFSHERSPLTESCFEAIAFPAAEDGTMDGVGRSRVPLESPVPGVYALTRVNAFSVGGELSRMREEALGAVPYAEATLASRRGA